MPHVAVGTFFVFVLVLLFATVRLSRVSDAELQRRLLATDRSIGSLSAFARAPLAWLIAATFGLLTAVSVLLMNETDGSILRYVSAVFGVLCVASTALAVCASVYGRPRALVLRQLRDRRVTTSSDADAPRN
jgi:hypothetical protein